MFKFRSTERLDKLETALERLDNKLDQLRTLPKTLQLEWEETLDKLARQASRLNQRARRDALASPENDEPVPDKVQPSPPEVGDHQLLSTMRERVFGGRR